VLGVPSLENHKKSISGRTAGGKQKKRKNRPIIAKTEGIIKQYSLCLRTSLFLSKYTEVFSTFFSYVPSFILEMLCSLD
jgi:hypothetical protein